MEGNNYYEKTGHSISDIILIIQGHLQCQWGQFHGDVRENIIFNK